MSTKILKYDLADSLQQVFNDIEQIQNELSVSSFYYVLQNINTNMLADDEKAIMQDLLNAYQTTSEHIGVRVANIKNKLEAIGIDEEPQYEEFIYDETTRDVLHHYVYTDNTKTEEVYHIDYTYDEATGNLTQSNKVFINDKGEEITITKTYGYNANGDINTITTTRTVVDITAPVLLKAEVNGNLITLTYDEILDETSVPATSDFFIYKNGSDTVESINHIAINGSIVEIILDIAAISEDTFTLDYVIGINPIQDEAGNDVAALTGQSITNITA